MKEMKQTMANGLNVMKYVGAGKIEEVYGGRKVSSVRL